MKSFVLILALSVTVFSLHAQTTIVSEDFTGQALPTGWSNIDNGSSGQVWQFNDPGSRSIAAPFDADFAILDSDNYGNGNSQNATLESAAFDASAYDATLTLSFDYQYQECCSSTMIVEIYNGTSWSTVVTYTGNNNYPSINTASIDILSAAGGATDAKVRFTYTGSYGYWFAFDNFKVEGTVTTPLADTDGDGIPNINDLDADNDGIPDSEERYCSNSATANSSSGTGAFQDELYFFNWTDASFSDGVHNGDSQTFVLNNGLTIAATISGVSGEADQLEATDMNTWTGSPLWKLYNTDGVKEAFYGTAALNSATFTLNFTITNINGDPVAVDILALDAEASTSVGVAESINFVTNGGGWTFLESVGNGGNFSGVGTQDLTAVDTYQSPGGSAIYYSKGATSLTMTINSPGSQREGVAFGIRLVCDSDKDGIYDVLDLDSDNDGVPDLVEAGGIDNNGDGVIDYPTPNDPSSIVDLDGDGLADVYDDTDSAGGTSGWTNGTNIGDTDSDSDGIPNYLDLDTDNDGIPDLVEAGGVDTNGDGLVDGLNPDGTLATDADRDGFYDIYDTDDDGVTGVEDATDALLMTGGTDTNGDGLANDAAITFINGENDSVDADGDGLPDGMDLDADNDGIPDLVEAGGIDADGNGLVDVSTDADKDGFADIYDTDNNGTIGIDDVTLALLLTGGTDTDGDGKADDAAITFTDGDGNSADHDGDGFADHLDLDADNDGVPDIVEAGGVNTGNGMVDTGSLPWDANGDGLADVYDENNAGTALVKTTADSGTADGKVNNAESMLAGGTNNINNDNHGHPNHLDLDSDNDGITDVVENASGAVTADESGSGDLDGIVDNYSDAVDNNGWNDSSSATVTDTDGDGVPDYLDIDADNDGIVDYLEGTCSTCPSFTINPSTNNTDSDGDGVLDIYSSMTDVNENGGTNIGTTPNVDDNSTNTTPDYLDTDTDSDGAFDWTEGYDANNNGNAVDDLINMANTFETATTNGYYLNATDTDSDGIPDWLDNQPTTAGYDETVRPPFLNPASSFWHDDDNDGLVDLFDPSQNGTSAPTPDNSDPGTGVDDFDWRDVSSAVALPVELTQFSVSKIDCDPVLNWTTASERDFDYFVVERSENGNDFIRLASVESAEKTNGASYDFVDDKSLNNNFYRLRIVNLDGSFEYSKILHFKSDCNDGNDYVNIFPNPIHKYEALSVEFDTQARSEQILIIDMLGRTVKSLSLETVRGLNKVQLDVSDLNTGRYQLQVVGSQTSRMIIVQE